MKIFSFVVSIIGVAAAVMLVSAVVFWLMITANGANPFR